MTLVFVRNYIFQIKMPWIQHPVNDMVFYGLCHGFCFQSASESREWLTPMTLIEHLATSEFTQQNVQKDVRKGRRCFLFDMSCLSPLRWLRVEILSGSSKALPQILKFILPRTSVTDLLFFLVQVPKCKVLKLESVFGGYLIIFNHGIHHY